MKEKITFGTVVCLLLVALLLAFILFHNSYDNYTKQKQMNQDLDKLLKDYQKDIDYIKQIINKLEENNTELLNYNERMYCVNSSWGATKCQDYINKNLLSCEI